MGSEAEKDEMAPDFRLSTLANGEVALSDFQGTDAQGKWVLINFWATWCIPCREEMPYLQELADRYPEQLVILGINMREELDEIQPFLDELGVTFPILLQPDNDTLLNYGVRALPLSFMVDPAGVLQMRRVGPLQPEVLDVWLADRLAGDGSEIAP